MKIKTSLKSITFILIPYSTFFFFNSSICLAEFHATFTATTDYISRGYSKSDGNFAAQANLDYEHSSGLYLGTSVVTVDFGDDTFSDRANVEITPYLGWTFKLTDDWRFDTQWTRYLYDGKIAGHNSDYNEFYLLLHYRDIFTARASFSEDFYNHGKFSGDYELTGRYPLTDSLEFSASIGYSQVEEVLEYDYLYWGVGLTYYYKFIALDFRYMDAIEATKELDNDWQYDPEVIDPSFVFSISVGF
jgi:uncharacterized protein (TIGR02001 family)